MHRGEGDALDENDREDHVRATVFRCMAGRLNLLLTKLLQRNIVSASVI